jgi:hypothetical protein
MKLKKLLVLAAAVSLTGGMARAVHVWEDPGAWSSGVFVYDRANTPRFTASELSLDLFGSYTAGERKIEKLFETNIKGRNGNWGGGVGLNYFITREIGLGGDINMGDNRGNLVDQALGSLILRWPFEAAGIAPYVFGGGGRDFDPTWEWVGHAGVGIEYRFNPATGIFLDGRYIWPDKSSDRILLRAGLRLVF